MLKPEPLMFMLINMVWVKCQHWLLVVGCFQEHFHSSECLFPDDVHSLEVRLFSVKRCLISINCLACCGKQKTNPLMSEESNLRHRERGMSAEKTTLTLCEGTRVILGLSAIKPVMLKPVTSCSVIGQFKQEWNSLQWRWEMCPLKVLKLHFCSATLKICERAHLRFEPLLGLKGYIRTLYDILNHFVPHVPHSVVHLTPWGSGPLCSFNASHVS